jgi:hypothetical protein
MVCSPHIIRAKSVKDGGMICFRTNIDDLPVQIDAAVKQCP